MINKGKIQIIFSNTGGELDRRGVDRDCDVFAAIEGMLANVPTFYNGDTITIECNDDEERR